jgi:hypothetical protein
VQRYEYRDDLTASAPSTRGPSAHAEAAAPRAKASQGYGAGAAADSAAASAPSGASEEESRRAEGTGNLGTEYGERSYSPVQEVNFSRQDQIHPRTVMRLYYDDENGLLARGIDVNPPAYPQPYAYSEPEPFPATRFAPPP